MKRAWLQLHLAVFLAGFTAVLGKLILVNEGMLVWYRMLLTVLTLLVLLYYRRQLQRLPFTLTVQIVGVGTIVAMHWVTFYGSVKYANISVALTCFSCTGFFTALFEPLLLRRRISFAELLLGLMTVAGIAIIFNFHPQYKLGIAFGIFSAMGSALFPIFNKRLVEKVSPLTLTLYEMAGGWLALSLLLPLYLHTFHLGFELPSLTDWGWLLVLALLCTVYSFQLQLQALTKLSAFTANLTYNLEPVYGIILAFVFFDERKHLHSGFYIGLVLIIAAVLLQMWRVGRSRN